MDYSNITMFSMIKSRLDYSSKRQAVLARSISQIDTPNFKAKDLEPLDFGKLAKGHSTKMQPIITSPSHMKMGSDSVNTFKTTEKSKAYSTKPVGNNVTVEEMMMKVSENAYDYNEALNLYSKTTQLFKTAIGNR